MMPESQTRLLTLFGPPDPHGASAHIPKKPNDDGRTDADVQIGYPEVFV
jgi:hypothetical protein